MGMKWVLLIAVLMSDGKEIEMQSEYGSPEACAERADAFVEYLAGVYEDAEIEAVCVREAAA
jgi:hypothetical protein